MAQLGWVVMAVILIGVLQFAVYAYFRRRRDTPDRGQPAEGRPAPLSLDRGWRADREGDDGTSGRRCPSCGATNDPAFTFCRECAGRMSG